MTSALSLSPAKPEGPSPSMSPLGGVSRTSRASFQAGAQRRDSSPPKEGRRGSRSTFDADEIQGMRKLSQMSADGRRGSVRTAEEEAALEHRAQPLESKLFYISPVGKFALSHAAPACNRDVPSPSRTLSEDAVDVVRLGARVGGGRVEDLADHARVRVAGGAELGDDAGGRGGGHGREQAARGLRVEEQRVAVARGRDALALVRDRALEPHVRGLEAREDAHPHALGRARQQRHGVELEPHLEERRARA